MKDMKLIHIYEKILGVAFGIIISYILLVIVYSITLVNDNEIIFGQGFYSSENINPYQDLLVWMLGVSVIPWLAYVSNLDIDEIVIVSVLAEVIVIGGYLFIVKFTGLGVLIISSIILSIVGWLIMITLFEYIPTFINMHYEYFNSRSNTSSINKDGSLINSNIKENVREKRLFERARLLESQLQFEKSAKIYEKLRMWDEAKRVRLFERTLKEKITQEIHQTIDMSSKYQIQNSVINRSNIGSTLNIDKKQDEKN